MPWSPTTPQEDRMHGLNVQTTSALLALAIFLGWLAMSAVGQQASKGPFVKVPDTVSAEAHKYLESLPDPASSPTWPSPRDAAGWKQLWEAAEAASEPKVQATLKRYQPVVEERTVGGVRVQDVKPRGWKRSARVLVHAHGGCYTLYSARSRLQSSVPAADATGLRVISIDYTVAPAGRWEQVIDEVLAVLDGLRKEGHELKDVAVYGESAGGALVAGATLKMRDKGLEMPAAVVLWSPWADITDSGDTAITLKDFDPVHRYDRHLGPAAAAYADPKDQKHPYVSPVYGDYSRGFPPTLIQGGTREIFLSHCVRQYRAIDEAGGIAILDLYDGMPHIFQVRPEMADAPETRASLQKMAAFLKRYLPD
jgi:acetyl esterase/lipase